ncbi:hypothetical protein RchiOBHm_Chr5g0036621 [Rosa chinensis]|uniref:Uncharacterized protein n=1 Tax=Rosa chinensis TaxID=74649 RepID=A0A2P6QBK1_ROSCH|nr:hypothetical protein RchiOBHm_Chr5g0036621 [Rosa chinensis]
MGYVQIIRQQNRYNDNCQLSEWPKMGTNHTAIIHITHRFLTNHCLLIYTHTTEVIKLCCRKVNQTTEEIELCCPKVDHTTDIVQALKFKDQSDNTQTKSLLSDMLNIQHLETKNCCLKAELQLLRSCSWHLSSHHTTVITHTRCLCVYQTTVFHNGSLYNGGTPNKTTVSVCRLIRFLA